MGVLGGCVPGVAGDGTSMSGPGEGTLGGAGLGWPGCGGWAGGGAAGCGAGPGGSSGMGEGVSGVVGGSAGPGVPGGVCCIKKLLAGPNALEPRLFLPFDGLLRRASLL